MESTYMLYTATRNPDLLQVTELSLAQGLPVSSSSDCTLLDNFYSTASPTDVTRLR